MGAPKARSGWLRVIWAITITQSSVMIPRPAYGGRRGLRLLGKFQGSLRLYSNRSGIVGRFSLRETLSINGRAITVETLITGKQRCALAIEISSPLACRIVFYYSSGWESWGFFPHGKSSRLTIGDLLGTLTTGKPNQGVGRFGGLLGVSATPTTRRVLVIWAGALSRNT